MRYALALLGAVWLAACSSDSSAWKPAGVDGGSGAGGAQNAGGTGPGGAGGGAPAGAGGAAGAGTPLGDPHSGTLSIGPVDFAETSYANGCGKYPDPLPSLYGNLLAGVETNHIDGGRMCDSCILVQSATGKSAVARVITYGGTNTNDIDVSPELNEALGIHDEAGRAVTWRFVACATTTPVYFLFHPDSHQWFFRVWIRNQRVPLKSLEVKLPSGTYYPIDVQGDGGWNAQAQGGDFTGGFSLRVTSVEGTTLEQSFGAAPAIYASPPIAAGGNL